MNEQINLVCAVIQASYEKKIPTQGNFVINKCVSFTLRKESRDPFSMNSVMIITGLLLVTTPSRWMMFGWSNWPMMDASLKKSRL